MKIPVIFNINNAYTVQTGVVISSILNNSAAQNEFEFYILSADLSEKSKEILTKIPNTNYITKFHFIDMNEHVDKQLLSNCLNVGSYITMETFFRLYIPKILPDVEKAIYLDADILVAEDLSKLYNENIEDYYAGVVADHLICKIAKIKDNKKATHTMTHFEFSEYLEKKLQVKPDEYFNAGVLLLNLKKIREDKKFEESIEFLIKESPLQFQDQCILNHIFRGKVKFLDGRWNSFYVKHKDPKIIHFAGYTKPWKLKEQYNNYDKEWWKYYKRNSNLYKNAQGFREYNVIESILFKKTLICFKIYNFDFINIYTNATHYCIILLNIKFSFKKQ